MTISGSNCSSEFLIFSFQHPGSEQPSPDCASQQYRNDHFHQIARNKRDNACPQSRLKIHACGVCQPGRAKRIQYDGSENHAQCRKRDIFPFIFCETAHESSRNQRQEQVAYQVTAGRSEQLGRTCASACKYREYPQVQEADKSDSLKCPASCPAL